MMEFTFIISFTKIYRADNPCSLIQINFLYWKHKPFDFMDGYLCNPEKEQNCKLFNLFPTLKTTILLCSSQYGARALANVERVLTAGGTTEEAVVLLVFLDVTAEAEASIFSVVVEARRLIDMQVWLGLIREKWIGDCKKMENSLGPAVAFILTLPSQFLLQTINFSMSLFKHNHFGGRNISQQGIRMRIGTMSQFNVNTF